MSLTITVNGGGTFTASMEEGPVSFTASLAAVGPQGPAGATGATGVVAATAPIVYTSGTQTVSMDTAYFVRSPATAGTDTQILSWDGGTTRPLWIDNQTRALFMLGTNKTGSTIAKGKAVYVSGATGNHPEITLAQANSELSSARTIGITSEEIANNGTGKVIVSGRLENVNTNGFAAGDTLYLSPSSAGGFTTTFPTQPDHGVLLGYVTRANANNGVIEVVVKNYQELEEQSDVLLTSKTNLDLLSYESSSGLWKNKSFSTLGLLTSATAATTYAPIASPTFTGTVTIPAGASISGFAPLASPALTGTPTAPTAAAATDTTQVATTAFTQDVVDAQRVNIQTFGGPASSGTFTWTKPAGAKLVQLRLLGAGGGGGGGLCTITANTRTGGGGGGGGPTAYFLIPASELDSTVTVVVGAGGAGGAGRDTVGSASAGSNGSITSFGKYRVFSGNGSSGTGAGSGFSGTLFQISNTTSSGPGGAGAAGTGTAGTGFTSGQFLGTGGGGGGGAAGGVTTASPGGAGGSRTNGTVPTSYTDVLAGGAAGTAGGNGTNGTDQDVPFASGTGGGGGSYATAQATGNGGNGGWPGGGGGGGAASDNTFMSGTGGNGANGAVIVITYF
jgi:hypothetical protein